MYNPLKEFKRKLGKKQVPMEEENGVSLMNLESGIRLEVTELIKLSKLAKRVVREKKARIHTKLGGLYLSRNKGRGMEFAETRTYEPGDDVRHIDWRVTARTGRPHTKLYREERERPVILFLDLKRSMYFGTQRRLKSVQAIRAATLFGWEALQRGDRVGSVCVAGDDHQEFKPSGARKNFLRQLHKITVMHNLQLKPLFKSSWQYQNDTDIMRGFSRLDKLVASGNRIRIFSDGIGLEKNSYSFLRRLSIHNEVTFILVLDPMELNLPSFGRFMVSDGLEKAWMEWRGGKQHVSFKLSSKLYFKNVETELNKIGVEVKRLSPADELNVNM